MKKNRIKEILRENLMGKLTETEPKEAPVKEKSGNYEKDYSSVQTKLTSTMLKQSQVMAAAGLGNPNDATDRSLFSKKVRKDKNDQGGQYLFDDSELAAVIKVLDNPVAYLGVKK